MSVFKVPDSSMIAPLFGDRQDTLVLSYLQGCMGEAYADSLVNPQSAAICLAGFCYFAGEVNRELIGHKPAGCEFDNVLMVPPTKAWEEAIQEVYQEKAKPWTRYATNRDKTAFDRSKLAELAAGLPQGYELRPIDEEIYNLTLTLPWAWDLCGNIPGYSRFAANALGFVIFHGGELVSGASSYAFFQGGIEVEIDTREDYRRQGLATICGAALILACLERGLYPNWDAHTKESLALAEKLGYAFDKEYLVFDIFPW
ncbi:MAG: GNAT family N-acetyltransferase [Bacillota bacterium]|nr:GNAT family N-acetyltransferase [Bacillota bacterium]